MKARRQSSAMAATAHGSAWEPVAAELRGGTLSVGEPHRWQKRADSERGAPHWEQFLGIAES